MYSLCRFRLIERNIHMFCTYAFLVMDCPVPHLHYTYNYNKHTLGTKVLAIIHGMAIVEELVCTHANSAFGA